jgi:hypothetical protein
VWDWRFRRRLGDDRDGVAAELPVGEDIDRLK